MQEHRLIVSQDLDQVLLNAQLRRSADIGVWLKQYFARRRQVRAEKVRAQKESLAAAPAAFHRTTT
jgi:hypothetical protein